MVLNVDERGEWVSWAEAAELTGLTVGQVEWASRRGWIEHRREDKCRPTLRRSSVEEYAARHRQEAERRAEQAVPRTSPPAPTGWLSSEEAGARLEGARIIGCHAGTVYR